MKLFKKAVVVGAALSLFAGTGVPAFAFSTPQNQVQASVEVVSTEQQARRAIAEVGQRLRDANLASFSSPSAQSEYLEARRDLEYGRYNDALSHARSAQAALPPIPNWITGANARR